MHFLHLQLFGHFRFNMVSMCLCTVCMRDIWSSPSMIETHAHTQSPITNTFGMSGVDNNNDLSAREIYSVSFEHCVHAHREYIVGPCVSSM